MNTQSKITFRVEWKELLIGTLDSHEFAVSLTMGILNFYFPDEAAWNNSAPLWAKGRWSEAKDAAEQWCEREGIPINIEQGGWIEFD